MAYNILCFGDSVTAGLYRKSYFEPYGKSLSEQLQVLGCASRVMTCGLCGLTAQELAESMHKKLVKDVGGYCAKGLARILEEDGPWDIVVLMAGTNDIGQLMEPRDALESTRQLVRTCKDTYRVPVVLLSPPHATKSPFRELRNSLHTFLDKWVRDSNEVLAFFDPEELVPRSPPGLWEPEEFHLGQNGSKVLGTSLAPLLVPLLQKLRPGGDGVSSHSEAKPSPESVMALGLATYETGEDVEVWSTLCQDWCPGKVLSVEEAPRCLDSILVLELTLSSGTRAEKKIMSSSDHLRHPQPLKTVILGVAYTSGSLVEVWSKSLGVWCPGQVISNQAGQVRVKASLQNGTQIAKTLPIDSAELRPADFDEPQPDGIVRTLSTAPFSAQRSEKAVYSSGDSVQIFSDSFKAWLSGKITNVEGTNITVQFTLPDGRPAQKVLPASHGSLRPKLAPSTPKAFSDNSDQDLFFVDYHVDLGMQDVDSDGDGTESAQPLTLPGRHISVWSNSHKAWCPGQVDKVEAGLVSVRFTLPNGETGQKRLPIDDANLRLC